MTNFSLRLIALFLSLVVFAHCQSSQSTPATTPTPAVSPQAMQDLGTRLATRINLTRQQDPRAQHAAWGISVVDLATGAPLYAENADKLLQPASNTKLFTTATTLALVGPDYRFLTTIEANSPPDGKGRVAGDVILVGRGDPNLSGRVLPYAKKTERVTQHARILDELVDQVAGAGVKVIDGDVVGDDSYFVYERYGEGWAQDDLMWDYGAPVSALTVNDNVVFASLKPGDRVGARALLTLDPYTGYYTIKNLVTTTGRGIARNIGVLREPGSLELTFWGTIPLGDPGDDEALAIEDPATANAQLLRMLLQQRGILVRGKVRAVHSQAWQYPPPLIHQPLVVPPVTIPSRFVLAQHQSAPLLEDLVVINKVSQNLHVELMLRLLGKLKGVSGSLSGGLDAEKKFLIEQVRIDPAEFALYDGSGLSRSDLATPHAFTQLLQYAYGQPWATQFRDTLPIAAEDGSLSTRFKGTFAADHLEAKTGQLGSVNSLSGYAVTKGGHNIAFSVLVNHHTLGNARAKQMIDDIVNAVLEED
ncbi:MAG TPA: D-alanyl-D-alanine carboxypeptidase/D-alanyl-D-alanine-endopeptidase [Terriglobales bacterium]|jgi:D-alanyl-D-alanine carboxypeptidase/D-alanyl-D-alanine-endopeptidase (penicillin-binding protein 4)|nr:D-alanyl-D-alanine carboxypeptidase/D-alanyl-D-alanine-endopeptidase [Terriglobales bacterium]